MTQSGPGEPEVTQTGAEQFHGVSFTRLYQRASGNAFLGLAFLLLALILIIPFIVLALFSALLYVLIPPLKEFVDRRVGRRRATPATRAGGQAPGTGEPPTVIDVEVTRRSS